VILTITQCIIRTKMLLVSKLNYRGVLGPVARTVGILT